MNIRPETSRNQDGSMLLITVIACTLVGTVLCSYLLLITNRNTSTMRATAWNSAMPILEAGIEEALTHLEVDQDKPTANNWLEGSVDGKIFYWKRRDFPDGSYYAVTNFDVKSPSPMILSAGYVRSPLRPDDYISRLVRVTATNPPTALTRAITAKGLIKLSGNTVIDGFNSAGFDSAIAAYSHPTNRTANGKIGTNSKQLKAIDVSTARVYGKVSTAPGGTVAITSGSIGDFQWSATHTGIQPGWTDNTMDESFHDNLPPPSSGPPPQVSSVGGSNITVLTSGSFSMPNFISNDQRKPMIVLGRAELWVKNDFIVTGSGYVYIAPGASLKLYVGSTSTSVISRSGISGGGVVNGTGLPAKFEYIGLPGNQVFNYSGSANFIGTINAPGADVALSGGASLFGAAICKTFTCSGGSSVHYDQALAGGGMFMVTDWREL